MADERGEERSYPSGEMDLKWRVAGEILRLFDVLEERPADDDLAELIERIFTEIKTDNLDKLEAGRPINVSKEVKKLLPKLKNIRL